MTTTTWALLRARRPARGLGYLQCSCPQAFCSFANLDIFLTFHSDLAQHFIFYNCWMTMSGTSWGHDRLAAELSPAGCSPDRGVLVRDPMRSSSLFHWRPWIRDIPVVCSIRILILMRSSSLFHWRPWIRDISYREPLGEKNKQQVSGMTETQRVLQPFLSCTSRGIGRQGIGSFCTLPVHSWPLRGRSCARTYGSSGSNIYIYIYIYIFVAIWNQLQIWFKFQSEIHTIEFPTEFGSHAIDVEGWNS